MRRHWSSLVISGSLLVMTAGCAGHQKLAVEYRVSQPMQGGESKVGDLLETGKIQLDAGLYSMALESFRGALRQSPDSAQAYNGLAIAYDRMGRADLAQRYFETAIAKNPKDLRYRNNLAQLYINTGRVQLAEALMTPDHIEASTIIAPESQASVALITPETAIMAASLQEPHIAAVDNDIALAPMEPPDFEQEVSPILAPQIAKAKLLPSYNEARFAILPMRSILVLQAYTQPETRGPQAPSAPEPNRNPLNFGGAFASAQFSPRRQGVRMERSSLGTVRLVTLDDGFDLEPKRASFSSFENRLSSWLPDAISREQTSTAPSLSENSAIFAAIERAQIELAFEQVERPNAAISKFQPSQFIYHCFFDAEDAVV